MFVRYFVELPLLPEDVARTLTQDPGSWVPELAREADVRGETLLADVGFGGEHGRVRKRVELEFGTPLRMRARTILPMRWTAASASSLFPVLDADLEVAPLGHASTQLAISARYQPPLGAVGRAIDRAALHRIAEATVKDFVDGIARALTARIDALA